MNKSKGFTIIELLVVVAIIAVLAAVVLVNVTSYINKGKDAAIKANMSTIITNSVVYFEDSGMGAGDYLGFGTHVLYTNPAAAITSANVAPTVNVDGTGSAFCVKAALKAGTTWCVDNTGFKGTLVSGQCDGVASWDCQ